MCGNPSFPQTCTCSTWWAGFRLFYGHAALLQSRGLSDGSVRSARFRKKHAPRERPGIDLSTNTTAHLIADIERLRQHLGIEHWLVLGGSWGSTLALAYAERHPNRVTEMVLNSIGTTTAWEIDWITRGVGIFFPEAWARFRDGVPEAERDGSLVDAYHHLLMRPDPAINEQAARHWCDWEMAIVAVHPNHKPHPRYEQPAFRLGFAVLRDPLLAPQGLA